MVTIPYYPVFLALKGKRCVVIGGGRVAERKTATLIRAGARVTVISPTLTTRLKKEKLKARIKHISRRYRKTDLKRAFLVISATNSSEENRKIAKDVEGQLINVVDTPSLCNFILPSIFKRGPLLIAISTSGISPAMSKAIRKELRSLYPARLGAYLSSIKHKRAMALKEIKDKKQRERFLSSLADPQLLRELRRPIYFLGRHW